MKERPSDLFREIYPFLTRWVLDVGWIEIGHSNDTRSFVRALDDGGLVFEGDASYPTLGAALQALEAGIAAWLNENGSELSWAEDFPDGTPWKRIP